MVESSAFLPQVRDWLTALSTPAVAAIGVWIAYQQFRINRYQFRRDIGQKRLAVFKAAKDLLHSGVSIYKEDYSPLNAFDFEIIEAPFLFGKDVNNYLDELRSKYIEILGITTDHVEGAFENDEERTTALTLRREYRAWMRKEIPSLHNVFRKYLDFTKA